MCLPPVHHIAGETFNAVGTVSAFARALFGLAWPTFLAPTVGAFPWGCIAQAIIRLGAQSFNHLDSCVLALPIDLAISFLQSFLEFPIGGVGDK